MGKFEVTRLQSSSYCTGFQKLFYPKTCKAFFSQNLCPALFHILRSFQMLTTIINFGNHLVRKISEYIALVSQKSTDLKDGFCFPVWYSVVPVLLPEESYSSLT